MGYREEEEKNLFYLGNCKNCRQFDALKNGYCKKCNLKLAEDIPDFLNDLFDGFGKGGRWDNEKK